MGANNVLPNVPVFTSGAPTVAQLNALSYAASFLIDQDVRPTWHIFKYATSAITAGAWSSLNYSNVAYDCDGVYIGASGNVQIVTQGFYAVEACTQIVAPSAQSNFYTTFRITGGTHNPHLGSGAFYYFGWNATATSQASVAAADNAMCIQDITPFCLYPGDVLDVQRYVSAASTMDINRNTSYIQGRFSTQFTGYLASTGT